MYNKNNKIKIGIIGYRSWIAQSLIKAFNSSFDFEIVCIDKSDFIKEYKSSPHTSCTIPSIKLNKYYDLGYLFVVPGKLNQDYEENYNEVLLAATIGKWASDDIPILFLSSKFEGKDNEYANHKKNVENSLIDHAKGCRTKISIFKPPAMFGELQSKNSPMLIPFIVNSGGNVLLNSADTETEFLYINDFIRVVINEIFFNFGVNRTINGDFFSYLPSVKFVKDFENVIKITPRNLVNLYKVFNSDS